VEQHRPWIAWVPIDHDEITPSVAEALRYAQGVVAYSKHGQAALQRAGFGAAYIPHGVDTNVYTPGNKLQARHNLELPVQDDTFLVGMVAANNFYPSRKCIPQALAAFARFHEQYPDSAIYLHMVDDESKEGVNVHDIAASLGLVEGKDVLIADQFDYQLGYPASAMADLYRSFDVLLNPSLGEGFGIPILEAMACGIPAIATTGTSMTELVEKVGWLVEGDPWWTAQGSWQTIPHVEGIVNALEQSCHYERNQFTARNDDARERALEYDFQTVVAPMWDEYLRGGEWRMRELKDDVVELAA
jgi:glycosyltransferase involved in cell wall biosynthesis